MPRKSPSGSTIIPASEVGMFTVCPESWRLKVLERAPHEPREASARGEELHQHWASELDEAIYLIRYLKRVLWLIAFAIILYAVGGSR